MVVFENFIRNGTSLMLRMEKQIKQGVEALPEADRVLVGEDTGWLEGAKALVDSVFGPSSAEATRYRKSMQSELERVKGFIEKGNGCSHGDWNIWLIGHSIALLSPYQHYPERAQAGDVYPDPRTGRQIIYGGVVHMGDTYETHGQTGAVGRNATASQNTFQQLWLNQQADVDLPSLANELDALRKAMRGQASLPEHDVAIGEVAAAQGAAAEGNGAKVLEHLEKAGKWAWETATKIGVSVAAKAIESTLKL